MPHSHRPSSQLHQSHKPFKSRHQTKSQLKVKAGGKVPTASKFGKASTAMATKADRKNAAKLLQQRKRQELLNQQRFFSGRTAARKMVALIPLCPGSDSQQAIRRLFDLCADDETKMKMDEENQRNRHWVLDCRRRFKQQLQLIELGRPSDGTAFEHFMNVMDACKVADYLVFLVSAEAEMDQMGRDILAAVRAQGMPTCHCLLMNMNSVPPKKKNDVKKFWSNFMQQELVCTPGHQRPFDVEQDQDVLNLTRTITSTQPNSIHWREMHPYMLADDFGYNHATGTMTVSGVARGMPFSANRLVHLQTYGDYQLEKIEVLDDGIGDEVVAEIHPNLELQESLTVQLTPDPMANEQTWPTEEEILEAEERVRQMDASNKKTKRVPKGTSSYQAAWIVEDENGEDDGEDEPENQMMDDMNNASECDSISPVDDQEEREEYESVASEERNPDEDEWSDDEERRRLAEYLSKSQRSNKTREQQLQEELEFPDEKDTPTDMPARIRFQKYRGLKSFRTSEWDPYENLPIDYARIYQFDDFKRTHKTVMDLMNEEKYMIMAASDGSNTKSGNDNRMDDDGEGANVADKSNLTYRYCAPPGRRIRLSIRNVPAEIVTEYSNPTRPLVVFGLLPHEQKMSVLNFSATRPKSAATEQHQEIVKSKDELLIACGFRRYVNRPLYSQATTGHLHKYERFFAAGQTVVGTVFAPITYQPCPVLLFRLPSGGNMNEMDGTQYGEGDSALPQAYPRLLATGSVLNMDPSRLLIKRIILTGAPTRIHKSSRHKHTAVIRYMFFDPTDIAYFRPIELRTKYGRRGHILDSIGTHGAMKCGFDKTIHSMDTVCMMLYKRVFPKWPQQGYHDLFGPNSSSARVISDHVKMTSIGQ